jgi:hypothetical protein
MDEEIPSTKHLILKPKEIVPIDKVARNGDGSAISVQLIHEQNRVAEERALRRMQQAAPRTESAAVGAAPVPDGFEPKAATPGVPPAFSARGEAIRVADILLENRIADEQSGWKSVQPKRRRFSRRTRDFFLLVGSVDLAILVFTLHGNKEPITFVYGISAVALLSSSAAWVMFVVMDDY